MCSVRDSVRSRQSRRSPPAYCKICKKYQQPRNIGRLCCFQGRQKQNQQTRQTCFQRETYRSEYDSHHPTTNFHREAVQDEHIKTRDLLQLPQGRQKRHVRKPPGCQQVQATKNFRRFEKQKIHAVRDSDHSPVHAQSCGSVKISFSQPTMLEKITRMLTGREKHAHRLHALSYVRTYRAHVPSHGVPNNFSCKES